MMETSKYKSLKTIRFKDLLEWSVQSLIGDNIVYNRCYVLAPIGSFLRRSRMQVEVQNDESYKQITVRVNNGGACLRGVQKGCNIGTKKQYLAKAGQLILSKIDARNGAVGIVPQDCDGAIVTGDFPLFDIDASKINPTFLLLISTTSKFVQFAQSCSNGTTNRQRIDIDRFLAEKIPFPTLPEQEELVAKYNEKLQKAINLEAETVEAEKEIERYLLTTLGININTAQQGNKTGFLQFVQFKDVERWDLWNDSNMVKSSKYLTAKLDDIITEISTGTTPPTSRKEYFGGTIKFYTPSDINGEMYLSSSERFISQLAIEDNKARIYKKGTILFVGIGSTVGKVGVVSDEIVSSNQQITGFSIDETKASPEYVFCYMHYNKDLTVAEQSKTTLPIVNQNKIVNIPIPLPPLSVQNKIVAHVTAQKEIIKSKKSQASALRKKALEEFEKAIFE